MVLERTTIILADAPKISRVRFRVVPEAIVRALELRKGSADLEVNSLTPDMIPVLRQQSALEVTDKPGTNYQYIAFNLDDRDARQARSAPGAGVCDQSRGNHSVFVPRAGAPGRRSAAASSWAYEPDIRTV